MAKADRYLPRSAARKCAPLGYRSKTNGRGHVYLGRQFVIKRAWAGSGDETTDFQCRVVYVAQSGRTNGLLLARRKCGIVSDGAWGLRTRRLHQPRHLATRSAPKSPARRRSNARRWSRKSIRRAVREWLFVL